MRLLAASVAALVTRATCQLVIWVLQRDSVRPSRLTSGARSGSWRSSASWVTNSTAVAGSSISYTDRRTSLAWLGVADLAVGVACFEQSQQLGAVVVVDQL